VGARRLGSGWAAYLPMIPSGRMRGHGGGGLPDRGRWASRAFTFAHIHPAPQYVVLTSMLHDLVGAVSSPLGLGLCRILDMNFREFFFHALG
jgi:hypothetical protein